MIELKDLTIGYTGKKQQTTIIASDINATIESGQLTCLLGHNGVGKSTLLKTLTAFLPKLSGQIVIDGKDIESYTEKQLARKIGVVLTERTSVQDMTVADLVALGRSPYTGFWGRLDDEDKEMVVRAMRLAGIENLSHRYVDTLSDGERQRAMIAKALAQDTPLICLDEPTSFLDFQSKVEMLRLLRRLSNDNGKTIFLSTHDVELALQMADSLWLMEQDHKLNIGTPRQLADNGSLSRFFDNDSISFDPATLRLVIVS
ncbi:MAG: ABC transporter ATP-binding protein [Prevotella sp.]